MRVPIKIAAQRSGLSPQRIRMWEKRHGILTGTRGPTNRRQFSASEVEHLGLLREATEAGHRIGDIADLPATELRRLIADPAAPARATAPGSDGAIARALDAIQQLDEEALRQLVAEEQATHGHQGMLQRFIAPLLARIGEKWSAGDLRSHHEHFATATLRTVLLEGAHTFAPEPGAPTLIATTPAGQLHEMGAVLAAAAAKNQGWRVLYLGANLPAEEIAAAARASGATLVALSIIHPADDPQLPQQLHALRDGLPDDIDILAGGQAVPGYTTTLDRIHARTADSLSALIAHLQLARRGRG